MGRRGDQACLRRKPSARRQPEAESAEAAEAAEAAVPEHSRDLQARLPASSMWESRAATGGRERERNQKRRGVRRAGVAGRVRTSDAGRKFPADATPVVERLLSLKQQHGFARLPIGDARAGAVRRVRWSRPSCAFGPWLRVTIDAGPTR